MLLDWGLEKAQGEGKGVYYLASDAELNAYEDLQFEELDSVTLTELEEERHLMVWRPSADMSSCDIGKNTEESGHDGGGDDEGELGCLGLG
jgi:hypothetical protein